VKELQPAHMGVSQKGRFVMQNKLQRIFVKDVVQKFMMAKESEGLASGSLRFYHQKLEPFIAFCEKCGCPEILSIEGDLIRQFLLSLHEKHSPGGVHSFFRAVHALFTWYDTEYEGENWRNPISRIKAPKVPEEILDPVSEDTVRALIRTCKDDFYGVRDKAILLLLDNTGLRASELLNLDLDSVDLPLSVLYVERGKGGHPRAIDFNREVKRSLRSYLKQRLSTDTYAFFINRYGERLTYDNLRNMLARRAKCAGIFPPTLHSFRRKHALDLHRAGESLLTIQHRLGHRTDRVLKRYIKLTREDMIKSARRLKKAIR
jgi:integrase/recombinase XerD